jgi:protein-disulfide isomerase
MAYKHRSLLVLIALIAMNAFVHTGNAQEGAYSVRLGDPEAKNELVVYFSLGCSHCLTYFDRYDQTIQNYVDRGMLKVELLEVPGLIDKITNQEAYERAQADAIPVSKTYACLTEENPEKAFEYIRIFVKSAKVALRGSEVAWNKWPYAKTANLNPSSNSPYFNAEAEDVQQELAKLFFLDSEATGENCMSNADDRRLAQKVSAQLQRFRDSGYTGVPTIIFNGDLIPPEKHRSMFLRISQFQ